jgi:peptidyl-prolyl cis-trans isomerase B (cyclophilin B)
MTPNSIHNKSKRSKNSSKKPVYLLVGILAIVLVIVATYFVGGFGSNTTSSNTPRPAADTRVLLHTSMGDITIQLYDNKPITTQNFLKLVEAGKYDGTVFHRIMKDFMIQGGVMNENLATIKDEVGSPNNNYKYTIAMAKTSQPNSATSSFFINTANNNNISNFDRTYTVFGKVVDGFDVVDAIEKVPVTANGNEMSRPTQIVTLISATVL